MNHYMIPPEDCLIARAIGSSTSLREAAKALNCDPGGLFRKVKRISKDHEILYKLNGKWALTPKGKLLVNWIEESIVDQQRALNRKSTLRFASTTWFTEGVLIPSLPKMQKTLKNVSQFHFNVPNISFEESLKKSEVDFVVVCHAPYDPAVAYKKIATEEWITIVPVTFLKKSRDYLKSKNFIYHNALNPNSLFKDYTIEGQSSIVLDHFIGVRTSVVNGLGWSVVPRILVQKALKDGEVVEVKDHKPEIKNEVCIWWLRERSDLKKMANELAQIIGEFIG